MTAAQPLVSRDEALYWLALRLTPGLGCRKALQLLEYYRTPQAMFRASRTELMSAGASPAAAQAISSGCQMDEAVDQQQLMIDAGAELLVWSDPRYPEPLRNIYDPPVSLFVRGDFTLLQRPMLAVVGSRRATPYGIAVTTRLAAEMAERGLVVVSGMAQGIDTAAHVAVLDVGRPTVAVFGCGVDVIYPANNRRLAQRIASDGGLLASEYPMGTPAYPQNFPVRNRIVSGLSAGVMVVEGSQYSGSAITARLALDQDREVFAVPGNITSAMSWGPNLLLKQGAHLVQSVEDVLEALPTETRIRLHEQEKAPVQACLTFSSADRLQTQLLDLIGVDIPVSLDALVERVDGHSPSEIIAALLELELSGHVRQLPGKSFVRVWV